MLFIWVDGDSEEAKLFQDLERFVEFVDPPFVAWVEDTHKVKLYGWDPYPERVSTYVRTGTLGHGWDYRNEAPGTYVFHNPTEYAIYVVGGDEGEGQAAIHVPFWWIALKVIEGQLPILEQNIHKYIENRFSEGLTDVGQMVT
jgi:hypothetical protein